MTKQEAYGLALQAIEFTKSNASLSKEDYEEMTEASKIIEAQIIIENVMSHKNPKG